MKKTRYKYRRFKLGRVAIYFSVITLVCFSLKLYAQSTEINQFRLVGIHTFETKNATSWTLDRMEFDEETGISRKIRSVASAKGEKAEFRLTKSKHKITIYHIVAKGESFTRKYKITVFDANKVSTFVYKSEGNADVRTYIFVPESLTQNTRVLLVMHGRGRNADDYIKSWEKWGKKNDYIIVSPEFDNKNWKRSRSYNLGNVFSMRDGRMNVRSRWSYQIAEDLHKTVKERFDLNKSYFDMFGHSAGAQFVHRFALFIPDSHVRIAIAANSGWYTLPDLDTAFPYGLKSPNLSFTRTELLKWSKRNVFLLRGTEDNKRTSNLRTTTEADIQGRNRFERAGFMFAKIKSINPKTNWRLIDAPRVGHDQKRMAIAAQYVLNLINSIEKEND